MTLTPADKLALIREDYLFSWDDLEVIDQAIAALRGQGALRDFVLKLERGELAALPYWELQGLARPAVYGAK